MRDARQKRAVAFVLAVGAALAWELVGRFTGGLGGM
jgi:hypothetical protein